MLHLPRVSVLAAFALATTATLTSAQVVQNKTTVRFYEPSGNPLPVDYFVVRDAQGIQVTPTTESPNTWSFRNVGHKLSFEFTRKGLKNQGFDVMIEDAPVVYISLMVDPDTGKVKFVDQKAQRPHSTPNKKIRKPATGQTGLPSAAPINDACANALQIGAGSTQFSTIDATTDGAPVVRAQFDGQTYEDIWFVYRATRTGLLEVSTCGAADYDTDLVLYEADANHDGV